MLKKRITATLPVYEGVVVQSIGFKTYLPVGKPEIAIEFLNKWGIDEIILVDISARKLGRKPDLDMLKRASKYCFVPLTVGGGVSTLTDVEQLMHCGADKVAVNRPLFDNPSFITDIANAYGDQCVVVSIDAIKEGNDFKVFNYLTRQTEEISVLEACKKAVDLGAGEIFINVVNRDGMYSGYETALFKQVCEHIHVPAIACGGAKSPYDMLDLLKDTKVSAASAGNFFNFSEHSVNITKSILKNKLEEIRLETHAEYTKTRVDEMGRILKKSDEVLDHLLYIKIEKEII